MKVSLLRALRTVIAADSDPARQVLFSTLMQSRAPVRLVHRLHGRFGGTWPFALLIAGYALVSFLTIAPASNRTARIVMLARHTNARREVARVAAWLGVENCGWIRTGLSALAAGSLTAVAALLTRGRAIGVIRVIRAVDRRYHLLVACRAADAIAWYGRAGTILRARRPGAVVVSSDSNPEEVAFVAAARTLHIPQVFVSHAYPTPFSPPLDFTLSILEGEAAVRARGRKGAIRGEIVLSGIEGESAPMDAQRVKRPAPTIGIFTPKAISWSTLAATVDDCRRHWEAKQVIIRWHPSMFEPVRLADAIGDLSGIVQCKGTLPLADVAARCDWVIADENSNVHLPVLKLGIPTVAIKNLGRYPPSRSDLYGFAADGVIFRPVQSIREVDPDALIAFFSECWRSRFAQYDASYLRPQAAVGAEVRRAIGEVIERATATTRNA